MGNSAYYPREHNFDCCHHNVLIIFKVKRYFLSRTITSPGSIMVGASSSAASNGNPPTDGGWSLDTLPFRVLARLLDAALPGTDDGLALRKALLRLGLARLLLACLAVFTHHRPTSNEVCSFSHTPDLNAALLTALLHQHLPSHLRSVHPKSVCLHKLSRTVAKRSLSIVICKRS